MSTWIWVLIAVAALVVLGIVLWSTLRARRTKTLRSRFGPEYDRVAADAPSRRDAEAELAEREQRREQFDIRPLDSAARDRYRAQWEDVQAQFVDDPGAAVAEADRLIQTVMRERGYPVEDFDTRAADLSVDHPTVVEHYRAAHGIAVAHERGNASTEDLRHAVRHYRALFDALVESRDAEEVRS
jgi:hypothetical protein